MGKMECLDCGSLIGIDNVGCKLCGDYFCPFCRNGHDCREESLQQRDKSDLYDHLYTIVWLPTKRRGDGNRLDIVKAWDLLHELYPDLNKRQIALVLINHLLKN